MMRTTVLTALTMWTISAGAGTLEEVVHTSIRDSPAALIDASPRPQVRRNVPPRSHEECLADSNGVRDVVYKRCRYGYTLSSTAAEIATK